MFLVFLSMVGSIRAHDIITHMYISSKTYDIWRDFDPDFYNALIHDSDDSLGVVRQFYLIGTTLPDLFDLESQQAISKVLNTFYRYRSMLEVGDVKLPFYINQSTIDQVNTTMNFNGEFPNKNLQKLYEMVLYARDHYNNWDKALVYGAYVHVVEDLFAHMVEQPAVFGYGKSVESDSVLRLDMPVETHILHIPEKWEEMFTPTYIDDWNFIKDVWVLRQVYKVGDTYIMQRGWKQPGAYEFSSFVERQTGRLLNGQNIDFYLVKQRCEKFVEAAQAVGYASSTLTAERMSAYLYGWGLTLFYLAGYTDPTNLTDVGGVYGHPEWSYSRIKQYMEDLTAEYSCFTPIFIPMDIRILVLNLLSTWFIKYGIGKYFPNPVVFYIKLPVRISVLAERYPHVPWVNFYQSVSWFDSLWMAADDSTRNNDSARTKYRILRRELEYWSNYSSYKNPALRSTYRNEIHDAIRFKDLYRQCINNGPSWLDYIMENNGYRVNEFVLMRKTGPFGGLFDISSDNYYKQPGIIDMHFEKDNRYVYTEQEFPL